MDQVNAQLQVLRKKLDTIPALEKAEVSPLLNGIAMMIFVFD